MWKTDQDLHLVCLVMTELFRSRQSITTTSAAGGKEKRSKPPENLAERRLNPQTEEEVAQKAPKTLVKRHLTPSWP